MHKGTLLNAPLQQVIASMGHTDSLTICDAGLPIPSSSERIDLALTHSIPSFLDTFKTIIATLYVEKVVMAEEIKDHNPTIYHEVIEHLQALEKAQNNHIAIEFLAHEQFKSLTHTSKAIARTGECTPYANIILYSGVVF